MFGMSIQFIPPEPKGVKNRARVALAKAIEKGEVIKPNFCSKCSKECNPEGHHNDYSKPLEVEWLCKHCHVKVHHPNSIVGMQEITSEEALEEFQQKWDKAVKRVAIYTRLSPMRDKRDTDNQESALIEFAKRSEWQITEVYRDIHVSGDRKDKPEFTRMLDDASKRKFDIVLFWSLDRFSREGVYKTLQYLGRLDILGIAYKSYTEQYLDSCGIFKEAVISIMATMAKQERVRLIERTKAGLKTARARGKVLGRPKAIIDLKIASEMKEAGATLREIGKKYDVSPSLICKELKKYQSMRKGGNCIQL